jgi:hypothetical protein
LIWVFCLQIDHSGLVDGLFFTVGSRLNLFFRDAAGNQKFSYPLHTTFREQLVEFVRATLVGMTGEADFRLRIIFQIFRETGRNGSLDVQVPAKENLAAAREALKKNPKATVMELAGMNHLLQDAKTGAPSEYNDIEETMSPTALKIITDWLSVNIPSRRHEPTR